MMTKTTMTPPAARKIVILPGWAGLATTPDGLAFELRKYHPAEVIPLHHLSPSGAPDAAGLLQRLSREQEPVWLLGLSMGGMLALEAAALDRTPIHGLLLLSTTARFCAGADYRHGFDTARIEAMIQDLRRHPLATLEAFFTLAAQPFSLPAEYRIAQATGALAIGMPALEAGLNYILSHDVRSRVGALHLPALVSHGRKDAVIPWRAGHWLGEHLPNAEWQMDPEAGHDAPLRFARSTAASIAAFCARHP